MSIHVIYGSRVTELPFAAAADSPVHWVMDKTAPAGLHTGQYLAASVRAADGYLDMPVAQLRAEFLPALERLFPAAAKAGVEDFFVTRERRATIAHVPGSQRLRLAQAGPVGFALAGAWTDTGWPDTMEGAVRSGQAAAQKLIAELPARAAAPGRAAALARAAVPARPRSRRDRSRPAQFRLMQRRPVQAPARQARWIRRIRRLWAARKVTRVRRAEIVRRLPETPRVLTLRRDRATRRAPPAQRPATTRRRPSPSCLPPRSQRPRPLARRPKLRSTRRQAATQSVSSSA